MNFIQRALINLFSIYNTLYPSFQALRVSLRTPPKFNALYFGCTVLYAIAVITAKSYLALTLSNTSVANLIIAAFMVATWVNWEVKIKQGWQFVVSQFNDQKAKLENEVVTRKATIEKEIADRNAKTAQEKAERDEQLIYLAAEKTYVEKYKVENEKRHTIIQDKFVELRRKIWLPNEWDLEENQKELKTILQESLNEFKVLLDQATEMANHNPKIIARLLLSRGDHGAAINYAKFFFYNSITDFYKMFKAKLNYRESTEISAPTEEYHQSFYQENTHKNDCRLLYNEAAQLLIDKGLIEQLRSIEQSHRLDERLTPWYELDLPSAPKPNEFKLYHAVAGRPSINERTLAEIAANFVPMTSPSLPVGGSPHSITAPPLHLAPPLTIGASATAGLNGSPTKKSPLKTTYH